MNSHALIDLHCDTLTVGRGPDTLDDPGCALSLSRLPKGVRWAQFFAAFIPDELRGAAAVEYFERFRASFFRQMERFSALVRPCLSCADMESAWAEGKTAAFLTVENGSVLAGKPERVETIARQGVRAVTLTWNGENELGSGYETERDLTPFGRTAVRELERHGVLVDASHLNDAGFSDLLETAERPFLATHSNARAICPHKRNLTDEMIREMARRGCLIGLNYYVEFLCADRTAGLDDVYRHIMHFFELGARQSLALGSDFDGAVLPACLNSPEKAAAMYEYLLSRGVAQTDVDGIFHVNAREFLRRNLP